MKVKTSELAGPALDWAVCGILAGEPQEPDEYLHLWETCQQPSFHADWGEGGPIIERESICVDFIGREQWCACVRHVADSPWMYAPTPLIAAMRCFVASEFGEEVDIPEELL